MNPITWRRLDASDIFDAREHYHRNKRRLENLFIYLLHIFLAAAPKAASHISAQTIFWPRPTPASLSLHHCSHNTHSSNAFQVPSYIPRHTTGHNHHPVTPLFVAYRNVGVISTLSRCIECIHIYTPPVHATCTISPTVISSTLKIPLEIVVVRDTHESLWSFSFGIAELVQVDEVREWELRIGVVIMICISFALGKSHIICEIQSHLYIV